MVHRVFVDGLVVAELGEGVNLSQLHSIVVCFVVCVDSLLHSVKVDGFPARLYTFG